MPITAAPHRNGDTPDTFMEIGRELHASTEDLKAALVKVRATINHGRNYQHEGSANRVAAQQYLEAKISHILEACIIAEQLGIDIFEKGESA